MTNKKLSAKDRETIAAGAVLALLQKIEEDRIHLESEFNQDLKIQQQVRDNIDATILAINTCKGYIDTVAKLSLEFTTQKKLMNNICGDTFFGYYNSINIPTAIDESKYSFGSVQEAVIRKLWQAYTKDKINLNFLNNEHLQKNTRLKGESLILRSENQDPTFLHEYLVEELYKTL